MSAQGPEGSKRGQFLSRALRAVRAIRKATSRELAKALGLSLRGYQHFEAGGGQLNVDHVLSFGAAIDCDPFAVLAGVHIGHPELAAYMAKNKGMIAYLIHLQEFVEDAGEAIAYLETGTMVSAYRAMFKDLAEEARAAQRQDAAWLAENAARLGLRSERPDDDEGGEGKGGEGKGEDGGEDNGET